MIFYFPTDSSAPAYILKRDEFLRGLIAATADAAMALRKKECVVVGRNVRAVPFKLERVS